MADELTRPADVDAINTGVRWRWGIVCVGTVLLSLGHSLGVTNQTAWLIAAFATVGASSNLIIMRLLSSGWYRPWSGYAFCLIDLLLVGFTVVYVGPGGAIAGFLLIIGLCSQRPRPVLAGFALVGATIVFVVAVVVHDRLGTPGHGAVNSTSKLIVDLTFFVSVAAALISLQTGLFARIATIHRVLTDAGRGTVRPPYFNTRNDSLGMVEQSLSNVLERMFSIVEAIQRDAAALESLGGSLVRSTSVAAESSRHLAALTSRLTTDLIELRSTAEAGVVEGDCSVKDASLLRSHTEGTAVDLGEFERAAELCRERLSKATETVTAVGPDIERTTRIVEEVSGISRQIGTSAVSIAKIARHTHILALNAAIEAARAKEHGDEFAVVADQVRSLAAEAGKSARDVGDLVTEVNARVAAVATAMAATDTRLRDVGEMASEARSAFNNLRSLAATASDILAASDEASESRATAARSFSETMSRVATATNQWSAEVETASTDISDQMTILADLERTSRAVTDLAEQLSSNVVVVSKLPNQVSPPMEDRNTTGD